MLADEEHVCNTIFHSNGYQVALFLFLYHLIKSADMHAIEDTLTQSYLSWWLNIHTLCNTHAKPFVFGRVYPVDSKGVRLSVIRECLYL